MRRTFLFGFLLLAVSAAIGRLAGKACPGSQESCSQRAHARLPQDKLRKDKHKTERQGRVAPARGSSCEARGRRSKSAPGFSRQRKVRYGGALRRRGDADGTRPDRVAERTCGCAQTTDIEIRTRLRRGTAADRSRRQPRTRTADALRPMPGHQRRR